jgi:hypothetical protein
MIHNLLKQNLRILMMINFLEKEEINQEEDFMEKKTVVLEKNRKVFHCFISDTHNFSSKVDRFTKNRPEDENPIGPGQYASTGTSLSKQNYNRNKHGYVGSKEPRFDGPIVRPHIGPGSYEANLDPVREKKVINIKM